MSQASFGFHCPECLAAKRAPSRSVIGRPGAGEPVVTKALIGINLAVAVLAAMFGGGRNFGPGEWIIRYGLHGWAVDSLGEWYRIVTSAFLHDGIVHLGLNLWALWMIGPFLERPFGRLRFTALVGCSLVGGAFGVLLLDPLALTIGASGVVFGLFGAVAVVQRSAGIDLWRSGIGSLLLVNLLFTFLIPSVSVGGHVGGLFAGSAVAAWFVAMQRARQPDWLATLVAAGFAVLLFSGSLWAASNWANPLF